MAKPRNNCFISLLLEALILKKIFKSYVSEKQNSVKGSDKPNKNKHLCFKKTGRKNKLLKRNNFIDSVFAEDSIYKYVIKSVVGFIGGILLTYICFMFFVFSLNFTLKRATLICMGLGVILSLGLAFSVKIRCTVFLCIPQLFSKRGRQALLAYAFILALSGPAKNTLHNVEVMSESLACGQEQIKQAENELVNCVQKPNTVAKKSIEKLLEKINPAVKFYKHFILQLYRTCFDILETFFSGQKWLSSIILLCNEKVGDPNKRCEKLLAESIENCKSTSTSENWENLCNINPEGVKQICLTKGNKICPDSKDFGRVPVPRLQERLNGFKQRAFNVLYVKVEGQQTHIQPNRSNTFHEEYQGMATEIRQKTDQFLQYFDFMSVIFGIFILVLFVKVVIYRHKFLTEDHYDNRFITRDFEDIDNTRGEFSMETVLPLTTREKTKYIRVTSVRLIPSEKVRLFSSFIFLIFATFKIIIHMLTDSCLYWILSSVRRDERLLYINTLREEQPSVTVKVLGEGIVADLVGNITKAVERQYSTPDLDPTPCLPDPVPPDYNRYYQIIALVVLCWFLALFEPYGLRLRHTVMVTYHPDRARERATWLYNNIMKNRNVYSEVARKEVRRKYRNISQESVFRFSLKKKQKLTKCLLCNDEVIAGDYYKCPTVNCVGIYCSECFSVLKYCSICKDGKEYEDLGYTTEEIDSSDEGTREDGKKCKCSKIKKQIEKSRQNRLDHYNQGYFCLKIRKLYFLGEKKCKTKSKDRQLPLLHQAVKYFANKIIKFEKRRKYLSDEESSDWDFDNEISSSANEAENKIEGSQAPQEKSAKKLEKDKEIDEVKKNITKTIKNIEEIKKDENNEKECEKVERELKKVETKPTEDERDLRVTCGTGENKLLIVKAESKEIVKEIGQSEKKIEEDKDKLKKDDEKKTEIFEEKKIKERKAEQEDEKLEKKYEEKSEAGKIETETKKLQNFEEHKVKVENPESDKAQLKKVLIKELKNSKAANAKWNINKIKEKYLNATSKKNTAKVEQQKSPDPFKKVCDSDSLPVHARELRKTQNEGEEIQIKREIPQDEEKLPNKMFKLLKKDFQKGIHIQLPKTFQEYKPHLKFLNKTQNHTAREPHYQPQYNPQHNLLSEPQSPPHNRYHFDRPTKSLFQYDSVLKRHPKYEFQGQAPRKSQYELSQQPQYDSRHHPQKRSQSHLQYHHERGSEPSKEILNKKENLGKDPKSQSKQTDSAEKEEVGSVRSLIMNVSEATGYTLPLEKMRYMNFPELKEVDEYNYPSRRRVGLQETECVDIPSADGSECLLGFFNKPQSQPPIPDEDFICIDPQKTFSESRITHICASDSNYCCRHMEENHSCTSPTHICRQNASDSNLGSIDCSTIKSTPRCISPNSEGLSRVPSICGLDTSSNIRRTPGNINIEWRDSSEPRSYTLDCSKFRKSPDPCREFGIRTNSPSPPKLQPLDFSEFRKSPEPLDCSKYRRSPEPLDCSKCRRDPELTLSINKESIPATADFSKYEKTSILLKNLDFENIDRSRMLEEEKKRTLESRSSCLHDCSNVRSPMPCRNFNFSPLEPRSFDSLDSSTLRSSGIRRNLNLESDYQSEPGCSGCTARERCQIFNPEKKDFPLPLIRHSESTPSRTRRRNMGQVTFAPQLSKSAGFYSGVTDSSDDDYLFVRPARKFCKLSSVSEPDEDALEIENILTHSFGEKNPREVSLLKANLAQTYKKNLLEERDTENEDYRDTSDIDDIENTPDAEVFLSDREFEKLSQTLLKEKEKKDKSKPQLTWAPDLLSDLPNASKPKDCHKKKS